MIPLFALLPFGAQGFLIALDEFVCHRRRGLSLWEQTSHLIDTLSFLVALSVIFWADPTPFSISLFFVFSILTCLSVTKDEWIHAEYSTGFECWLHSLLFILHPLALISAYSIWTNSPESLEWLKMPYLVISGFGFYQLARLLYEWSQRRKRSQTHQQQLLR